MKEIIPYVQQVEARRPFVVEERNPSEEQPAPTDGKAFTRWMAEKVQNKRHESGRINFHGVDHSSGPAHTVCPYVPHFLNNIEDGIKPLVLALVNKGYLTYSSCSGHQSFEPRYVGLAIPSEEFRERVVNLLSIRFKLWQKMQLFKLIKLSTVANNKFQVNSKNAFTGVDRGEPTADEAEGFNTIFYRNYPLWLFLRIQIGYEVVFVSYTYPLTIWKRLECLWAKVMNRLFRERITKQVVDFIESKEFPQFIG